jgi:ATP-dependent DNA helicase RecQ
VRSSRKGFSRTVVPQADAVGRACGVAVTAERVDMTRVEMMRNYAESGRCRRQLLLSYFGDHLPKRCGNCDVCWNHDRLGDHDERGESPVRPDMVVHHREWGRGVVLDADGGRLTILFDDHGYRTLDVETVREHGLLRIP